MHRLIGSRNGPNNAHRRIVRERETQKIGEGGRKRVREREEGVERIGREKERVDE